MHFRPAEFFLVDNLTDGGFDQRRTGEIKPAAFRHQNLVAEHGQICATGHAISHDGGELRNARGGNDGVVAEDAAEIVFVGKNFILHRQKHAGGIDQVNDRQVALEGDALGADQLLRRLWKERAGFHGRVIGNDHAGNAGDVADSSDTAGGGNFPPLFVHAECGPKSDFEKRRVLVEQLRDALAGKETSEFVLTFLACFAATFAQLRFFARNRFAMFAQRIGGRPMHDGDA